MARIKAHFDGRFIVPDEPVELAPGEQILVDISRGAPPPKNGSNALQAEAARRFFRSFHAPVHPPEAHNRENLYRDDV
jgi:hypothetical protein